MQPIHQDSVSAAAIKDVYRACQNFRLLSEKELRDLKLSDTCFNTPDSRLPETTLIQLWQVLENSDVSPGIGLIIGKTIEADSKGLLASWVSQASTLMEALEIFLKHIALMNPSESWELIEDELNSTLVFSIDADKHYPHSAVERSMTALVAWADRLCGQTLRVKKATFNFKQPDYLDLFPPLFGENIHFDSPVNSLTFESKDLLLPVLSGNELLKNMMQEKALKVLSELSDKVTLSHKVELLISQAIDLGQSLTIDESSKLLAKSRQTLYRQLKQEETDFQSIYDKVRKEKAIQLLTDNNTTLSAISLELGFKDTSSFYKAFRRWTGKSPKQYFEELSSR